MIDHAATAREIEAILRERFAPEHLAIRDDSANHAGHAGNTTGGGHYKVVVVSAAFDGRTLLERHRAINEALADFIGPRIHALALKTLTPAEWAERQGR